MIVGDTEHWISKFRGYDERLLPRIANLVPECVKTLGANAHEDNITMNLVDRLTIDPVARELFHYIEYQFEPFIYDAAGNAQSTGKIDLAAHIDRDRRTYIAYECKRLNVKSGKSTASLATPYVNDGVIRFVTEQYSEGLPVGCMLGYVLNSDIVTADKKVRDALVANKQLIALIGAVSDLPEIASVGRFVSRHKRKLSGTGIEVRHALVPCV